MMTELLILIIIIIIPLNGQFSVFFNEIDLVVKMCFLK